MRPHPNPEAVLAGRKMLLLRALVVLLSAGVIASCAYGMSQVEPQLVATGIALLDSVQVWLTNTAASMPSMLQARMCRRDHARCPTRCTGAGFWSCMWAFFSCGCAHGAVALVGCWHTLGREAELACVGNDAWRLLAAKTLNPKCWGQAYGNSVFAVIYGVLGDVGSVVGLLGQVQTILNVDVNVTDISADITVCARLSSPQICNVHSRHAC